MSAEFRDFSEGGQQAKSRLFPIPLKQSLLNFAEPLGKDFLKWPTDSGHFCFFYVSNRLPAFKGTCISWSPELLLLDAVVLWRRLSLPTADNHPFGKTYLTFNSYLFQPFSFLSLIHPNSEVMFVNFIESCPMLLIYSLVKAKGRDLAPLSEWLDIIQTWRNTLLWNYVI